MKRTARRSFLALTACGIAAAALAAPVTLPEPPKLTDGLHGNGASISTQFDQRVEKTFPIGSSEYKMKTQLKSQGFTEVPGKALNPEHEQMKTVKLGDCRNSAHVYWKADSSGEITAVRGVYKEGSCL